MLISLLSPVHHDICNVWFISHWENPKPASVVSECWFHSLLLQELYEELPALYDQRIPNIASHLQTLYAAEATVMAEFSKVSSSILDPSDTACLIPFIL